MKVWKKTMKKNNQNPPNEGVFSAGRRTLPTGTTSASLLCQVDECKTMRNRWTHITTVWSGVVGTLTIYMDGLQKWEGADVGDLKRDIVLGGILGLGQDPDTFGDSFDEREAFTGIIDEFRVWRYAKSAAEITSDHAQGVSPSHPNKDKLLVHLTFDNPLTAAADPLDFTSFGGILKAVNGGDADPLLLGKIPPKNEMRYVTERKPRRPSLPRFVPSTVPLLVSYHSTARGCPFVRSFVRSFVCLFFVGER